MGDLEEVRKVDQVAANYFNEVTFSEGYECETCGWNYDNLSVAYEGYDETWYIHRSSGCYGGWAEEFGTLDEAVTRLEQSIDDEFLGEQNNYSRNIKEMISLMREFETNRK